MPTIVRTTSGMISPSSGDIKASISTAKGNFVSGTVIAASQINSLLAVWRTWNDHYHQTSDYANEAYGNRPSAGTFYANDPDYTDALGGNEPADVVAGDVILAQTHEEIRTALVGSSSVLGANDHGHYIDDYTL